MINSYTDNKADIYINNQMIKKTVGNIPRETGFIGRFRKHQGWWRAFVLNEAEGQYWDLRNKQWKHVCNRINNGEINPHKKNFLSVAIANVVEEALNDNEDTKAGIINRDRLYNNLLSSQPLAFNFFGFLKAYPDLALAFIKSLKHEITGIKDIRFEYAPDKTVDHSAFDFGFIVESGSKTGFIGFECKYTDKFSSKRTKTNEYYGDDNDRNYNSYYNLYKNNRERFPDDYYSYIRDPNYNQLFRNELLAVQLNPKPDFIVTGLFCHHDDKQIIRAGGEFRKKIGNGADDFIVLTYADYFNHIQKLDLTWEQRELVMMLWARYCGLKLSESIV